MQESTKNEEVKKEEEKDDEKMPFIPFIKKEEKKEEEKKEEEKEEENPFLQNDILAKLSQLAGKMGKEKPENTEDAKKAKEEKERQLSILNIKTLTDREILLKSFRISLLNWKSNLFNLVKIFVVETLSLYIPILNANLVDSIIQVKSYDEIYSKFKTFLTFLIFQFFVNTLLELFNYFFIRDFALRFKFILLEKIIEHDITFFEVYKTGEIIHNIDQSEDCIDDEYLFNSLKALTYVFKAIVMYYYLHKTSGRLTLIFMTIFLIKLGADYIFLVYSSISKITKIFNLQNQYSNQLNELFSNIRLVKSFAKEDDEIKIIEKSKMESDLQIDSKTEILLRFTLLVSNVGEAVLLLFVGKYILQGKCTLGIYTLFKRYQKEFQDCYREVKSVVKDFKKVIANWRMFFELYDFPVRIKSTKNLKPSTFKGKIKFENVSFAYPLKPGSNILENLSFEVKPGKMLAICGSSGSGKTTISNLIQRFYDINSGQILIDDIDIKDYNIKYLRRNIGFVAQEPSLKSGTIEENIVYGVDDYKQSFFEQVLELSNINSFINDKHLFPDGLKTLVGEKGSKVSGGQKQRIAIARALLKNTKIIILDEATSALDAESESAVQKAIDNIVKTKEVTMIVIAHRLSTIINADTIAVLNHGKIVEMGTHKELMEKDGEYKKLFQKQIVQ